MEEAWELAALMENLDDDFLKDNEFAFSFHLQKIRDSINEFSHSYSMLSETDISPESDDFSNFIWDNVYRAASAAWQIAQTLDPVVRGKKAAPENIFKVKRGRQLQALLNISISDKKVITDFRNRLMHFDEDFDEWYVSAKNADLENLRVVWRGVSDAQSPVHTSTNAVVQWYDYRWGVFHSFGKSYSLRAFKSAIELLTERVLEAEKYLTKLCPNRMKITVGRPL